MISQKKGRRLAAASAVAFVGACSAVGYAAFADPSQCEIERDMIRDIRTRAVVVMDGVDVTWIPTQGCKEEATEPLAGLAADVPDWRKRRLGLDHMASRGWLRQPDTFHFTSRDGDYQAAVIMSGVADGHGGLSVPMHVEISFSPADDTGD